MRGASIGIVVALAGLVALGDALPAQAQYARPLESASIRPRTTGRRGTGGGTPSDTRGTFQIDSAFSVVTYDFGLPDDPSLVDWSLLFGFRYDIVPVFELEVQAGLSLISPEDQDTLVNFSNILVGGFYVARGPSWRLRIGGGLGLPTARIADPGDRDRGTEALNLIVAGAQRGMFDFALWYPERLSFQLPSARFVYHASPEISVMAETAISIFVDTGDDDDDTHVGFQLAGDFGWHPSEVVSLGARLNLVFIDNDVFYFDDDEFQASLEPHFRVNFGAGFFQIRLTINLDHPFGFAFDDGRVWAIHLGGGADF